MEELNIDYTELQATVEKLLPGEFPWSFEELAEFLLSEKNGWKEALAEIGKWAFSSVTFPLEHGKKLFFLIILSALFSNLSKAFARDGTSHMGFLCVYLLMAANAVAGFSAAMSVALEGTKNLCSFVSVLLPMYCLSITVVTGSATAAGYYQGTTFLLAVFEFLVHYCLLPMAQAYLLLSFASCMQKKPLFERLLELIVSVFSWVKKTLLGMALAFGAVQGILTPAVDSLKRTAAVQSASAIPGVGSLIGGAWETVLGAGVVLKNSIGLAGMIFLLLVVLHPVLRLLLEYLVYRVLAAITEPVTQEMTGQFLQHMGTAQWLLLEALVLGVIMFLLVLVVMTRISV